MKLNLKKLLSYILITFFLGNIFVFLVINNNDYAILNKPFNLPGIIFPIVWSILYLLMAISSYFVSESNDINKNNALRIYFLQLLVNSLWTLIFFGLNLYLFGFIWILLLIVLVGYMIKLYFKINKKAGLINIPYLLWLIFAGYLNLAIVYLN